MIIALGVTLTTGRATDHLVVIHCTQVAETFHVGENHAIHKRCTFETAEFITCKNVARAECTFTVGSFTKMFAFIVT